jgi:hypothetical protein
MKQNLIQELCLHKFLGVNHTSAVEVVNVREVDVTLTRGICHISN